MHLFSFTGGRYTRDSHRFGTTVLEITDASKIASKMNEDIHF
jgi:hypothetical protein